MTARPVISREAIRAGARQFAPGWFGPGPNDSTDEWWRSRADSPEFVGFWRDMLEEGRRTYPEAAAITFVGPDGKPFIGWVKP